MSAALACACAMAASPARAATITEIPFPGGTTVEDVLAADDGGAWVALDDPRVVHLTRAGAIDQTYTFDTQGAPSVSTDNLAFGPGRRPWATITRGSVTKLAELKANGTVAEHALKTPTATVTALAAGSDGNMWFAESGSQAGDRAPRPERPGDRVHRARRRPELARGRRRRQPLVRRGQPRLDHDGRRADAAQPRHVVRRGRRPTPPTARCGSPAARRRPSAG